MTTLALVLMVYLFWCACGLAKANDRLKRELVELKQEYKIYE